MVNFRRTFRYIHRTFGSAQETQAPDRRTSRDEESARRRRRPITRLRRSRMVLGEEIHECRDGLERLERYPVEKMLPLGDLRIEAESCFFYGERWM